MKNDDFYIQSMAELLNTLFTDILSCPSSGERNLVRSWKKILEAVPADGEKLAAHSRIIDLKNGVLFLETDHSGWIQLFGLYKNRILKSLKKEFPELNVNGFSFTLKHSKHSLGSELRNVSVEEKEQWLKDRGL